jgi:hypothetical protein
MAMRSWKRLYRARHKAEYRKWKMGDHGNYEAWGLKLWRKRRLLHHNRSQKTIEYYMRHFAKSMYVEDCRYHPCLVTEIDRDDYYGRLDIEVKSLVNGIESSCSCFHCGIVPLSEDEAKDRAQFIKFAGMLPYQIRYVYATPDAEAVVRAIRSSLKMEQVWQFNKGQHTPEITPEGKAYLKIKYGVDFDSLAPFTDEEWQALA